MKKRINLLTTSSAFLSVTFIVVVFVILSLNATYDRHNVKHGNPSGAMMYTQEFSESMLQKSEKDIVFIENLGQIKDTKGEERPDILFFTRSEGVDMYMTNSGITYVFRKRESNVDDPVQSDLSQKTGIRADTNLCRLDMEFVGMNKDISIRKEWAVEQKYHYYTPEYPDGISPWAYKKLTIENLYEGIDLVYYEKEGRMKYDFILKAGADAGKIKMKYKGASSMDIDNNGNVIITTQMGEIWEEKPYTYSRNTGSEIESSYRVKDNTVLFDIAEYDESEDIIIDPIRIWATYYGGSDWEQTFDLCTDDSANLYVTGRTWSQDFPTQTLSGAYNQTTLGGDWDVFILKFNSSGARIWATYYGGNAIDQGHSICTDNSGNLYVTGRTNSGNFPTQTLTGAYNQSTSGGSTDVFILKFNSSGVRQWATFYGGSDPEHGWGICTDNSANLYVTGRTNSGNFPTQILSGAYNQTTLGGGYDVFILKFNSSGVRQWATFYGGSGNETGWALCTDNSANLYVTGETGSTDFPIQTLTGAYNQTTYGGGDADAFILKFNNSGDTIWATYYGGSGSDGEEVNQAGGDICTDTSGNLYVTGYTASTNFPTQTLTGAYNQTTYGGGDADVFILEFNSSSARIWATYYGGSNLDEGHDICTDHSGNLYVTGRTNSENFPTQTLTGAYNQTAKGGNTDVFILEFNSSGASIWATYYGGSGLERGRTIFIDNRGNLYVAGGTSSSDFPTLALPGAYNDSTKNLHVDVYILRFALTADSTCSTTVMNTNDSGPGSLRDALDCAVAGDTILFDAILLGDAIHLTTKPLVLEKDLTIISTHSTKITILSEVPGAIEVIAGAEIELNNLNIISGPSGNPAALDVAGICSLINCDVVTNPSAWFPVILINNTGSLFIDGSCNVEQD